MTIRFRCQQIASYDADRQGYVRCGHAFEVANDRAGETIVCPECGNSVDVPAHVQNTARPQVKAIAEPVPAGQHGVANESGAANVGHSTVEPRPKDSLDQQLLSPDASPLQFASFDHRSACKACGAQIRPGMERCPGCHRPLSSENANVSLANMRVQPAGVQRYLMKMLSSNASSSTTRLLLDGFVVVPAILISLGAFAALGFFAVFLLPPMLGFVAGYFITTRHLRRMMKEPGLPLLPWQRFVWNSCMPVFRSFGWALPESRGQPAIDLQNRDLQGIDFQDVDGIETARVLDLTNAKVTDRELLSLYGMKQLRGISLIGTQVTDEGVFRLQQTLLNTWIWY